MADEVRRSGRANKGHHTKNQDALDEPVAKAKPKSKPEKKSLPPAQTPVPVPPARSQSAQSVEQQDEEDDAIYRCVCGDQREIRGREMIMCDRCEAWQHNKCLGLPEGDYWTDKTYLCEQCKPEDHAELLAAMARGEKPWNRKKGSKAPRPKFRPSDVGTDAGSEKNEPTTTQALPVQPPTPASTQAPAVESTPLPSAAATPTKQETPKESANGHGESKVAVPPPEKKTVSNKSQPQSPQGEKRPHDAIAEKETSAKRRKSSAHNRSKSSTQPGLVADPAQLPEKQRLLVQNLITSLGSLIKEASSSRGFRIPDGATPTSIATKLALQIDQATLAYHGEPSDNSAPYTQHFRSIIFNTKKNTILLDRLLSGSLSAEELASMSTEEMASEDKQKEYAAMREAAEKQMVLTEEPGPRMRKTHKGDEIVGEDETVPSYTDTQPPERVRGSVDISAQSPTQDGARVPSSEELAHRGPLAIETSNNAPDHIRRQSTTFDVNSVFDKVKSPQNDQQTFLLRRQSSIRQQPAQTGPGDDADVDRLLKDEDNDVDMTDYTSDSTIAWKGLLEMATFGPMEAVARFTAGGDFGQILSWSDLLTQRLSIEGRIESQRGNDYIQGLAQSGGYDVAVLEVHPVSAQARAVYNTLFNYFHPRDRWGVIPIDPNHKVMRDLYVIPVAPGGDELPRFLNLLETCNVETPRPEPLLLLALVAKLPEERLQSNFQYPPEAQPGIASNGPPSATMHNPHGPQFSPVQPGFPPGQGIGAPYQPPQDHQYQNGSAQQAQSPAVPLYHRQTQRAIEIFGPHIESPVVLQCFANAPMSEDQMTNLRAIMDRVPAAATDVNVLSEQLAKQHTSQP